MNEFFSDMRSMIMPLFKMEIPLAIMEVTEACWPDENKRPLLHEKARTKQGWDFTFKRPADMTHRAFCKFEETYRDRIGDITTEMVSSGNMSVLKIITDRIADLYTYDYNFKSPSKMILPIPIGYTHSGLIIEDLAKIPHILIGGWTGGGKSGAIHSIVNSLVLLPKPPKIVMVDLKQLEYTYLSKEVLLAIEQDTASNALARLVVEMRNRFTLLRNAECVNIEKYNKKCGNLDYIVLIIDELAELRDEKAQDNLETLLRLCRATGICIIAATQRPDAQTFKKFGQSKANFSGRLCFAVADGINSKIIIDSNDAASIPVIPGRAIWKIGKCIEVQVPFLDPEVAAEKLGVYYDKPIKQSSKGRGERLQDRSDLKRVGHDEYRAVTNIALSLLSCGTKAISKINHSKTN